MKLQLLAGSVFGLCLPGFCQPSATQDNGTLRNVQTWSSPTRETRPWTRWWWLGSAVDETNLTRMLTEFRAAGFGGVEICPIYGAKGFENRFVDFLSPRWAQLFAHTVREASRLDLGVDLTTGTGWPFGGPHVIAADASARIHLARFAPSEGSLASALPKGQLQCLMAVSDHGETRDLTDRVRDDGSEGALLATGWTLYALTSESPIQRVKRAAPGGEGSVLNPYSVPAMDRYLSLFEKALKLESGDRPRAFFHDSFEYYDADWAPDFLDQFRRRRGYDLRQDLPALAGYGETDRVARVQGDFRETLSDLHIAYIERWTEWAHQHDALTRDQAHGSPANLVDAYAAADIPETEIFGALSEQSVLMNKFASSAAHLTGRKLSSAESFTWLTDHFQCTLAQAKTAADRLFLTGVNHLVFHGIPYSPADAPWPGWQFYAAVNFGPEGGLWHDLPFFNDYLARCESILQSGAPANDVLLYFPVHDFWDRPDKLFMPFSVESANRWLGVHPIHATASFLWNQGYGYDVLTDAFLRKCRCEEGKIVVGGNPYSVILVPPTRRMPETSLKELLDLARSGATVLIEQALPQDVPGWGNLDERRIAWRGLLSQLKWSSGPVQRADLGKGRFLMGTHLEALLTEAGVRRETCVDLGMGMARRRYREGYHYFLVNQSEREVQGWVSLGTRATSALLMDPRNPDRIGLAALKNETGGTQIYLQLAPGESIVVRTFAEGTPQAAPWRYPRAAGKPAAIAGRWRVDFIDGGPDLPDGYATRELASWTAYTGPEYQRFAGTARYTIEFEKPQGEADDWILDLGKVCESARIKLNGERIGALWSPPFDIPIGLWLKPGANRLEVEVTNLAANRIRDLDRRKVRWKYFDDLNVVGRDYKPLDASNWPLRDSGLLGPVTLQAVRYPRIEDRER